MPAEDAAEPMELERPPLDFGAINWASEPLPFADQIDPATVPQLVHANEGISITTAGYLVRWRSHSDHNTAWDYLHADMEMENYVKLYTSQHFEMNANMEEDTRLRKMDWLINRIAVHDHNNERWGIISCDITPQKDIIMGLRDQRKVQALIANGWMVLPIGTEEPLTIACGPLVEQGTINCKRYEIGCRFPPRGIPLDEIISTLSAMCKVKEVVLGNVCFDGQSVPVSHNGFTAYVAFGTAAEATQFPTELQVHDETVRLWHRGKYECETCKEKGHTAEYHDKLMKVREKVANRKHRQRERKRRYEERKARGN